MANVYKKKFTRSRKYKKKPSEKMADIKAKSYRATASRNKNAISTVAKRLTALEKKSQLLQIRNTFYTSNNATIGVINNGLQFGVIDQRLITQPVDMSPMFNWDGLLNEGPMGRHISSRIYVRCTLKEVVEHPLFINVVVLKLHKSNYNQVMTNVEAGSGLQTPANWNQGREVFRDVSGTNGSKQLMWNPKFFKVCAKRRMRLSVAGVGAGFQPNTNYSECEIPVKIGMTYKKKSGTLTGDDNNWRATSGTDYDSQYYCIIYHEGFNEITHNGLIVDLSTEFRHTIKQAIQTNNL